MHYVFIVFPFAMGEVSANEDADGLVLYLADVLSFDRSIDVGDAVEAESDEFFEFFVFLKSFRDCYLWMGG